MANGLSASPGETVTLPITINSQGNAIAAAGFRVRFDESQLRFDPTDADEDGIPDAVRFQVPDDMITIANFNANNHYLEIAIIGMAVPMPTLTDGEIISITLQVRESATANSTTIQLTDASLGDDASQDVAVNTTNGTVTILQPAGSTVNHAFFLPIVNQESIEP